MLEQATGRTPAESPWELELQSSSYTIKRGHTTAVTLPGEIKQQPERVAQLEPWEPQADTGRRQLLYKYCKTKSKTLVQQPQKIQPPNNDVAAQNGVTLSST